MWSGVRLLYQFFTYWRQGRRLEKLVRQRLQQEVTVARALLERAQAQHKALEELHRLSRSTLDLLPILKSQSAAQQSLRTAEPAATKLQQERTKAAEKPEEVSPLVATSLDPRMADAIRAASSMLFRELRHVRDNHGTDGLRRYLVQRIREAGMSRERLEHLMQSVASEPGNPDPGSGGSVAHRERLLQELGCGSPNNAVQSPNTYEQQSPTSCIDSSKPKR
jgi:hypothetical protein